MRGQNPQPGAARPVHVRWQSVTLVALGGAAGTAARQAITVAVPSAGVFPMATLAINVAGAFLLGTLLALLSGSGPDAGRLRSIRLLLGTGFLGGFTTYSALAADTVILAGSEFGFAAVAYSLGTLLLGGLATWAGIAVAARLVPPGVSR